MDDESPYKPLSRRNKRRKRSWYNNELPEHKDFNIGHWCGKSKPMQLRRCNNCGHTSMKRSTKHMRWDKKLKKSVWCGSMPLVREPVFITIKEEEE